MEKINNFLYYALIIAIFGYLTYYLHSRSLFILLIIFIVFPAISCAAAKYTAGRLTVKAVPETLWTEKGRTTQINFVFENTSLLPVISCRTSFKAENRYLKNDIINCLDISLPAHTAYKASLPLTPVYNGILTVNITDVSVRDMLNIFGFKAKKAENCCVFVKPLPSDGEISLSPGELYSEDSLITAKNINGTQIDGVRSYIPGDKLRNIHWKLSTKYNDLLVKEYSDNNEESAILLVELYTPCIDSIIDTVYGMGLSFTDIGYPYTLCFASAGSEQLTKLYITDKNDLIDAIKTLYLSYDSQSDNSSLHALRREYAGGGIIYIHGSSDGKAVTDIL